MQLCNHVTLVVTVRKYLLTISKAYLWCVPTQNCIMPILHGWWGKTFKCLPFLHMTIYHQNGFAWQNRSSIIIVLQVLLFSLFLNTYNTLCSQWSFLVPCWQKQWMSMTDCVSEGNMVLKTKNIPMIYTITTTETGHMDDKMQCMEFRHGNTLNWRKEQVEVNECKQEKAKY